MTQAYYGYWGDDREEVQLLLYEIAVNEVVDFWVSAWLEAGRSIEILTPINQPIKTDKITVSTGEIEEKRKGTMKAATKKRRGKQRGARKIYPCRPCPCPVQDPETSLF